MTGIPRRPSEPALVGMLILAILVTIVILGVLAHAGMLAAPRGVGFRHP
jgi:hypothetical protein